MNKGEKDKKGPGIANLAVNLATHRGIRFGRILLSVGFSLPLIVMKRRMFRIDHTRPKEGCRVLSREATEVYNAAPAS